MRSKKRTRSCWLKVKPQNGGLKKLFFKSLKVEPQEARQIKTELSWWKWGRGSAGDLAFASTPIFPP